MTTIDQARAALLGSLLSHAWSLVMGGLFAVIRRHHEAYPESVEPPGTMLVHYGPDDAGWWEAIVIGPTVIARGDDYDEVLKAAWRWRHAFEAKVAASKASHER